MTLTCPACGGRLFKALSDTYADCDFVGKKVMMSDKERIALREKHERAIAARGREYTPEQLKQIEDDLDTIYGPTRYVHTPQGTRMKGRDDDTNRAG